MDIKSEDCPSSNGTICTCFDGSPTYTYAIKVVVASAITFENVVVLIAILQNWKTLIRQHNLYRFLLSLVAADLLNGTVLLVNGVFRIATSLTTVEFANENFQEVLRNLIIGVLHGLTFASLASAALLNMVLRITSTYALARAAAINTQSRYSTWIRKPRITITLICVIWIITIAFVIVPLLDHCHHDVMQCVNTTGSSPQYFVVTDNSSAIDDDDPEFLDCSIFRAPAKQSYLLALNACICLVWCLMVICNTFTICVKTQVKSASVYVTGENNLQLRHTFGLVRDTSSFFAFVITLSMTLSTIPYIIFTFVTETGSLASQIEYSQTISEGVADFVEMMKYFSSAVNPIIYTAMFSRLRSDITRLLDRPKISIYAIRRKSKKELKRKG